MIKLLLNKFDQVAVVFGIISTVCRILSTYIHGGITTLDEVVKAFLGGSLLPIGITLILSTFDKSLIVKVICENRIYIAMAGITILYVAISNF